jgi:Family of unknown function (DUF5908)
MPIEIKELIIRASVRDESEKTNGKSVPTGGSPPGDTARDEQIINRCVEQVMEILKIKNER